MPRSMTRPTSAGDQEGERQRDGQRPGEQAGHGAADRLLHHEGRVGAEHDHLAMRHVDDAHDAEGDGEADGGEQQHRAERQAVPDVLRRRPTARSSSRSTIAAACAALRTAGSSVAGGKPCTIVSVSRSALRCSVFDRLGLRLGRPVGLQHRRGARLLEPRLDAGVGLRGDRRVEGVDLVGRRGREHACSAAAMRLAGSGERSVSVPRAAVTARRMEFLTRILVMSLDGASPTSRRSSGRGGRWSPPRPCR